MRGGFCFVSYRELQSIAMQRVVRKVVAFCPWIESHVTPFDMCGVRVMGFRDAEQGLSPQDREALWRARIPYYDHFLGTNGALCRWNENPLLYVVDPADPLKEPTHDEVYHVALTNSYLYVCVFAMNRIHRGGGHEYTNSADWALYFHPVQNPVDFSLGERRLYGTLHMGGHRWNRSAFTEPVECNRFTFYDPQIDRSLVDGVTNLHAVGRATLYLHAVRTFRSGTSDNHLMQREEDFPFIWGAVEQIAESDGFGSCAAAQQEVQRWAGVLTLAPNHSTCLVRAVSGRVPGPEYVWNGDFHRGRENCVNAARRRGIEFSALERAMDELNFARNRMVHDGFVPQLDWNVVTLAFLGSRFWVALFKRILAWEGVRKWTEDDECDLVGMQAFAREGRTSFGDGYAAYEQAVRDCHWDHTERRVIEHLERAEREGQAP